MNEWEPQTCLLDRPSHYRLINPESNRHADILSRMRVRGTWDVNTSIAFKALTWMRDPWNLTREFVRDLLEHASRVSAADHDRWLKEVEHESWIYDCPEPRPTFDEYLAARRAELYCPDYDKVFRSNSQSLYSIEGLPTIYLLCETTHVENFDEPLIESRHYVDLGPVVAPISLPSRGGRACYIES